MSTRPSDSAIAQARDCRGYAHLGTGHYLINHSASGEPAELCISIATEDENAGRVVGDSRDNAPGNLIQPESMVVRLRFENVDGLDALEHQLRLLRQVHFHCPTAEREDAELTTEHARVLQDIPKPDDPGERAERMQRKFRGVGHLEETGYIPAGSAAERETEHSAERAEDVEALSHAAVCSRLGDEQKDPVLRAALWDAAAHIRSHVAKPEGEAVATYMGRRLTPEGTKEFWGWLAEGVEDLPPTTKLYLYPPRSHGVVVDVAMVEG